MKFILKTVLLTYVLKKVAASLSNSKKAKLQHS